MKPVHPKTQELPTVVLAGRVNVGKSTLFNRLAGMHRSLVSPVAGTTRDIQDAAVTWRGTTFRLIDTGGLDVDTDDAGITAQVVRHAKSYIASAQLVLLITEVREGILPADRAIARTLRTLPAAVRVVVNKADSPRARQPDKEAWKLGFGEPLIISSLNGTGTGDLMDAVVAELNRQGFAASTPAAAAPISIAIIGKPNVGKSTLVNAILGYERAVVSPLAHTTREPIDTLFTWHEPSGGDKGETPHTTLLIDTAGIRKHAKISAGLEQAGVARSLAALRRADVAILVVDLTEGINDQDKNLAGVIRDSDVGVVIVGNKWDRVRAAGLTAHGMPSRTTTDRGTEWSRYIAARLPYLPWAPVVFASALSRANVHDVLAAAFKAAQAREFSLTDEETDEFFRAFERRQPLPRLGVKGVRAALVNFSQTGTKPPQFKLTVRTKEKFPEMYAHALERDLRGRYDFSGTPIRVTVITVR